MDGMSHITTAIFSICTACGAYGDQVMTLIALDAWKELVGFKCGPFFLGMEN